MDAPVVADVDCLIKLLATAGKALEAGSPEGHSQMDAHFHRIKHMMSSPKLVPRLRCLLKVRASM